MKIKLPPLSPKLIVAGIGTAGLLGITIPAITALVRASSLKKELDLVNGTLNIAQNENTKLRQDNKDLQEDFDNFKINGRNTNKENEGLKSQMEVIYKELNDEISKNTQLELKRQKCAEKGIYYTTKGYKWVLDVDTFNKHCK